jgi:DNA-directed RNA polymerase delta subunit
MAMIRITNGVRFLTVTSGAFKNSFERQGWYKADSISKSESNMVTQAIPDSDTNDSDLEKITEDNDDVEDEEYDETSDEDEEDDTEEEDEEDLEERPLSELSFKELQIVAKKKGVGANCTSKKELIAAIKSAE